MVDIRWSASAYKSLASATEGTKKAYNLRDECIWASAKHLSTPCNITYTLVNTWSVEVSIRSGISYTLPLPPPLLRKPLSSSRGGALGLSMAALPQHDFNFGSPRSPCWAHARREDMWGGPRHNPWTRRGAFTEGEEGGEECKRYRF